MLAHCRSVIVAKGEQQFTDDGIWLHLPKVAEPLGLRGATSVHPRRVDIDPNAIENEVLESSVGKIQNIAAAQTEQLLEL